MRVLVTNGETRPALAITRSLGRLGHQVVVAAAGQPSLASVSRYCAAGETCPDPAKSAQEFGAAIVEIARRQNIELLLPVNEVATTLVAENRANLPPDCQLPLPANASLAAANDKAGVLALAARLGVPVPHSITIEPGECTPDSLAYPVVVKPARSRARSGCGWVSGGTAYAADRGELERQLAEIPVELFPVLLQERIVGEGVGVFACYRRGRPVAFFSHRRLREKPPSGGVSVLAESVALDPVATGYAERLLSTLDWHGVAMVEFKRDSRDGTLRLMEINGRFWGSLQLAIDAGVDFPALVASLAGNELCESSHTYRAGVRSRWFLGDLDALAALWCRTAQQLQLPPDHPGRWRTLAGFLNFWRPLQRGEVLRLDDWRPGWLEIRQWLAGQ